MGELFCCFPPLMIPQLNHSWMFSTQYKQVIAKTSIKMLQWGRELWPIAGEQQDTRQCLDFDVPSVESFELKCSLRRIFIGIGFNLSSPQLQHM